MTDHDMGERLTAALSAPRDEIDEASLLRIIDDVLRPVKAVSVSEVATIAGTNYRERQNIKRKAARWTEMFADLPPLERLTMLRAIADGAV